MGLYFVLILLIFITGIDASDKPKLTKDAIDFCTAEDANSCGPVGKCLIQRSGNRCECPDGFMGKECKRPCQDIYKSCVRWHEERRCDWALPISPFFYDNCPHACGRCTYGAKKLKLPLPPILEPLAWIIGEWHTRTRGSGSRYPVPFNGPYEEMLKFSISEIPSFDRPPLNVSITAKSLTDEGTHQEVGFMTVKPFREDTGFAVLNKPEFGDDLVAIEMVSSHGLITIEEGILYNNSIVLSVKYGLKHPSARAEVKEADRTFTLITPVILEEKTRLVTADNRVLKFRKKYIKRFDYLTDFIPVD
uniref:EGF-like domain-containing protein n=1 Tax=Panagrellus redivivus TaxID=6233 RepID=A0A7E4UUL6_PANRE